MTGAGGLRDDVAEFIRRLTSGEADTPENMGPVEARAMYRQMCEVYEPPRGELAQVEELSIPCRDGTMIGGRLYAPHGGTDSEVVVLFFHGGGWVIGDLETHDSLCAEIARQTGWRVVAADYRLAPEHAFPQAYHDCLDAMAWVAGGPTALGAVGGLVLAGDSAGGTLASACVQRAVRDGGVPIVALASFYATFDMNAAGGSMADFATGYLLTADMLEGYRQAYFRSAEERAKPEASPLLAEAFDGHPPALIFACEYDPLRDGSRTYAARLAEAGVSVRYREAKGHIHGCVTLRTAIPSGVDDLAACLVDLKSLVAEGRREPRA